MTETLMRQAASKRRSSRHARKTQTLATSSLSTILHTDSRLGFPVAEDVRV